MNKHAEIYEYELCTSFYNKTPFVLMAGVPELMVGPVFFVFLVSCRPSGTYNIEVGDVFLKKIVDSWFMYNLIHSSDWSLYDFCLGKWAWMLGDTVVSICFSM
jgi:hypothetical protein